jgi:PAB-dependent poly(A)-specific ribonuclease subunit 2
VIDTVDLYFLKSRQRRLSLRFLTWFVLHEKIQTDTHDSIEDARCALRLYKAYHEFEEKGTFDKELEELYKTGKQHVRIVFFFSSRLPCFNASQDWKPPPSALPPSESDPPPAEITPPPTFIPSNSLQQPAYPPPVWPPHVSVAPSYQPQPNPYNQNWKR